MSSVGAAYDNGVTAYNANARYSDDAYGRAADAYSGTSDGHRPTRTSAPPAPYTGGSRPIDIGGAAGGAGGAANMGEGSFTRAQTRSPTYNQLSVHLTGWQTLTDGDDVRQFTSYCVEVRHVEEGRPWTVKRRYSQFHELHLKV
jgi:hypothetical protein